MWHLQLLFELLLPSKLDSSLSEQVRRHLGSCGSLRRCPRGRVVVWLPSEPSFRRPRRSSLMIGVELTPLGLVLTREVLGRILIHLYREVSKLDCRR